MFSIAHDSQPNLDSPRRLAKRTLNVPDRPSLFLQPAAAWTLTRTPLTGRAVLEGGGPTERGRVRTGRQPQREAGTGPWSRGSATSPAAILAASVPACFTKASMIHVDDRASTTGAINDTKRSEIAPGAM
jgi:hypothetical protein